MNRILSEKEYQAFILEYLSKHNGYIIRKDCNFDRLTGMDKELLFQFLDTTQPKEMAELRKIFKDSLEETLINFITNEMTKAKGSLLYILKHGIDLSNIHLDLMYTKPATGFNPELTKKYEQNIFSVAEEIWASDTERVDVVIFLNGFAIISF